MRLGSTDMEPCMDASPFKGGKKKKKTKKTNASVAAAAAAASSSAPPKGGETSLIQSNDIVSSPKASLNLAASGSLQLSPSNKVHSALHDGLSHGSSSSSQQHDKTPLLHSAASSRTRRTFSLSQLSSSMGSLQRRQRKKEFKQARYSQPVFPEGRHPEESTGTESKVGPRGGDFVLSPASTVQTAKCQSSKRRRGKQGIKFLRRALSSPPILLHRFHSNPIEKDQREWQETSLRKSNNKNNNSRRLDYSSSSSNNSNSSYDLNMNLVERTRVVPNFFSPSKKSSSSHEEEVNAVNRAHCSATSILHHSYLPALENLCGVTNPITQSNSERNSQNRLPPADRRLDDLRNQYYSQHNNSASCLSISEDPTVQESIECIFASQLEDGLKLWDEDDQYLGNGDEDKEDGPTGVCSFESLEKVQTSSSTEETLVSPTGVQQSRMNRKDRNDSSKSLLFANMSQTKKRYEQASLVYVGTFDPSTPKDRVPSSCSNRSYTKSMNRSGFYDQTCCLDTSTVYSNIPTDPLPCVCHTSLLPSVEPKNWPQAPIALRPTPGKGTKVTAIRFSNSSEPLWVPGSHLTWSQRLEQHWGRQTEEELRRKRDEQPHYACCEQCVILPINNGNEKPGESLVVDFESELFEGTFMLRLRYSEGTTPEPYDDTKGYFKGMNRRYQVCIRGRFKKEIPFTELTTGYKLDRKFGKLPSKWVVKGALKVVSFFAPQLEIKVEGVERPYSVTPLGSTPQCINVDDKEEEYQQREFNICDSSSGSNSSSSSSSDEGKSPDVNTIEDGNIRMNQLDGIRVESSEARRSILGIGLNSEGTTSLQRAKIRKKAFDKLYVKKARDPKTDPSKIYTFEFLQHMLNFQDFTVELGSMLGSLKLEDMLDGQPLPIMACYGEQTLWSFDVWNECLWKQAQKHDVIERQKRAAVASP